MAKLLREIFVVLLGLLILFHALGYITHFDSKLLMLIAALLIAHGVIGLMGDVKRR